MIPFKNLKSGFSFIEIMVALTLLGIFGSSLFLVQSNMLLKVSKTHFNLSFMQDAAYDIFQLKNKIQQAVLLKNSVDSITIHEDKKNPHRKINLKLFKISDQSELKDFSKNVRIVQNSVTYDNNRIMNWFSLVYIPELIEESKAKPEQAKTVQK